MTLSLDTDANAAINSSVRGVAWLVQLEFTTGVLRYTTAPVSIRVGADVFIGGKAVDVSSVKESENADSDQLTLGFTVDPAVIALALGGVETYRGKPAKLWLQLLTSKFKPAGAPVLRWTGVMNKVSIPRKRSAPTGGAGSGRIELICSRSGMARARNYEGLRLSHAQQQLRFPGDNGLRNLQSLIEKPSLWLSKRFQKASS